MVAQVVHRSPPSSASEEDGVPRRSSASAMQSSVLALNRNFHPVHVISARRAFCILFKGQAEIITVDDGQFGNYTFDTWLELCEMKTELGERQAGEDWISAVNFDIQVPRIIRLSSYDRVPRSTVKFNRRNILLRDGHRCQYCGKRYSSTRLSLDHVMPKSRGGGDTWENVVCACVRCNVAKGGRTPQEANMPLLTMPTRPKRSPLLVRQLASQKYSVWRTFLTSADALEPTH